MTACLVEPINVKSCDDRRSEQQCLAFFCTTTFYTNGEPKIPIIKQARPICTDDTGAHNTNSRTTYTLRFYLHRQGELYNQKMVEHSEQNDAAPRLSESLAPLLLIHSALHPTASRFSSTLLRPLPLGHAPKSSLPLPLTKPPAQSNQRHLTLGCCTTSRKTKMFW